ncbi:hypothetical protein WA158_002157 [Blastocystis sp. Blastoise]
MIVTCRSCNTQIQAPENCAQCRCPICQNVVDIAASAPAGGQSQNPAWDLFSKVDVDHSNALNRKELQTALQSGGLRFTLATSGILLKKYSANGETIDFNGFQALLKEIWQWKAAFDFYDTDKGGFLDKNEFIQALIKIGYNFPQPIMETMFKSADEDQSGSLELDNFIKIFFHIISQIQAVMTRFSQLDTQRVGTVSMDMNSLLSLFFDLQ